jgi:hypothetical protein
MKNRQACCFSVLSLDDDDFLFPFFLFSFFFFERMIWLEFNRLHDSGAFKVRPLKRLALT